MKDNFSAQANEYAQYRPSYPDGLFAFIKTHLPACEKAWDCATGNGQAAVKLAAFFDHVYATDISPAQLDNAVQAPNIYYSVQPAEHTSFMADQFDLVMVAQAVHWFDFEKFYAEVSRTAKANALLVITGYGKLTVTPAIDAVLDRLYLDIVGRYWDKERRYIDEMYRTIPFPFEELSSPVFSMDYEWPLSHLTGYLQTWSAVKHYQNKTGNNPLELIMDDLRMAWGDAEKRIVRFPLLLRTGRIGGNR